MKITVQRSGGIAGMKRTWTVQPTPPEDTDLWQPLIEACPWDAVPRAGRGASVGQPDRFLYNIRAGQHRATLPEQAVTGPWRDLVETAKAAAEPRRRGLPLDCGGQVPAEGAAVGLRARVQHLGEVVPQQHRVAEAGFAGDFVDIEVRGLKQFLGPQHAL